jgi:prepilin-type N-terminal cleavage/methylation domain-containing protein
MYAMRRGYTLVELLVVMAILAILVALTIPTSAKLLAGVYTERAARELMAAHRLARFTAIMRSRSALLSVQAESLVVRVIIATDTQTVWRAAGPAALGVSLEGPAYPLAFAPTGLPRGVANATYTLERNGSRREVVVSRLGRVRIVR